MSFPFNPFKRRQKNYKRNPEKAREKRRKDHAQEEYAAEVWADTLPIHRVMSEWDIPDVLAPMSVFNLALY